MNHHTAQMTGLYVISLSLIGAGVFLAMSQQTEIATASISGAIGLIGGHAAGTRT